VKDAKLVVVQGAPHGVCSTMKDRMNEGLLTSAKA
jgi:non-heme chloroperoxidase